MLVYSVYAQASHALWVSVRLDSGAWWNLSLQLHVTAKHADSTDLLYWFINTTHRSVEFLDHRSWGLVFYNRKLWLTRVKPGVNNDHLMREHPVIFHFLFMTDIFFHSFKVQMKTGNNLKFSVMIGYSSISQKDNVHGFSALKV